ncbi:PorT family protein [Robertkochia marina]|uniref:PorT family protein n=1 Tax=Robertkochia marina TaxID=1227945 RepID=A0A4S3M402_9FLAO|nr:porin family protein [Robertkochia marina]THD69031.1 PorT family protein [Robertkochia marina]TRZ44854.1 PorT family protein [Robertkochia marina]
MKKLLWCLLFLTASYASHAQLDSLAAEINDTRYFEDQFYLGMFYNALTNQPGETGQSKLSYGFQGGFIKDLPVNKRRSFGFGLGIGMAYQSINNDLRARQLSTGLIVYNQVAPGLSYRRNTLSFASVEIPLEIRWRASTAVKYKFWRIYGGVKLNYNLGARSTFVTSDTKESFSNDDVNDLMYGTYLSFGYNTWNFYLYYQLNPLFKDNVFTGEGEEIASRSLNLGLIFYIL